jgi:hypothetical protein
MHRWQEVVLASAAAVVALATSACAPHIGDHCNVNSDCSIQGNLQCDTSQPNGYCTQFNCTPNACPNNAACVAVNAAVPGCPYDDYHAPSRTAVNMCLQSCSKDSDCRTSDGYVCRDPTEAPWNAVIVDNVSQRVCLAMPTFPIEAGVSSDGSVPPVCLPAGPAVDASLFTAADGAGEAEASSEGGEDAGPDAADAGSEGAADAQSDVAADAPDAG